MLRKYAWIVLFVAGLPAMAWARRGGGFGGGRGGGGFGGGFRGGGFGGGRGGGLGGFGGFGGNRSYGGRSYGGGGFYGGGFHFYYNPFRGVHIGTTALLIIIGVIIALWAALAVYRWWQRRYTLVNVGVLLRRGDRYAHKLDQMLENADFSSPVGRVRALHQIAKMIDVDDVEDGFVKFHDSFGSRDTMGEKAETLSRAQMQRIGIEPEAVNVANVQGQSVRLDAPSRNGGGRADACVLCAVASVRAVRLGGMRAGGEKDAVLALQKLYNLLGSDLDALYFYYYPNDGQAMDTVEGKRVFTDLRAEVRA